VQIIVHHLDRLLRAFFTSDAIEGLGGKDIDFFGIWISFTW